MKKQIESISSTLAAIAETKGTARNLLIKIAKAILDELKVKN